MKIVHPIKMNLIFISRYIYISPSYHPMVSPLYRNYITSVQTCYFYPSYITRDGLVLCTAVWLVQSSAGLNHCITTSQKMGDIIHYIPTYILTNIFSLLLYRHKLAITCRDTNFKPPTRNSG